MLIRLTKETGELISVNKDFIVMIEERKKGQWISSLAVGDKFIHTYEEEDYSIITLSNETWFHTIRVKESELTIRTLISE